jgi:hypothetical protein
MKDRIFENALNVIRNYLKEEGVSAVLPTNNASDGNILDVERKGPPVDLRKNKYKKLPGPYRDLFRRTNSVKPKYPR